MTEHQKYDLLRKIGGVEIRRYHPCVMADVIVNAEYERAGNIGFRPLVTYISQNSIAMTAPVVQEQQENKSWVVSFVMPARMQLSQLPLPKDAKVKLREITEHNAAALAFRGITTFKNVQEKESLLRNVLDKEGIKPAGPLKIARFDPPWKPGFLRHNEVIIPISENN